MKINAINRFMNFLLQLIGVQKLMEVLDILHGSMYYLKQAVDPSLNRIKIIQFRRLKFDLDVNWKHMMITS